MTTDLPLATAQERFWAKVEKTETCWLWVGATRATGYGNFWLDPEARTQCAHRVAYTWLVGLIPQGLDLDHLCRVRNCVNPDHLEPVTRRENSLRGRSPFILRHFAPECSEGHPFTTENTWVRPGTQQKRCRVCMSAANRAWRLVNRPPKARAPKTECVNGHPYAEGSYRIERGFRVCKACDRARRAARRERLRKAAA